MAYNIKLANRVREALMHLQNIEEKEMFSGVCFMINNKMCVCISGDELLCRIGADKVEAALEQNGTRQMIMKDRPSKDFLLVSEEAFHKHQDFDHWIKLCLDFNPKANASKKKK